MALGSRESLFFVLLYMILVVVWLNSVINRAARKGVRRTALSTGIIMLGWITLRLIKYQIPRATALSRYLWFSYYLFQLSLPIVILWLAWIADQPDKRPAPPPWLRLLPVISGTLIALVYTNDLHNLVFRVDLNNPNWPFEYGYGPGYYFVLALCFIPITAAIAIMLYKGRQNLRKKGVILPLALFFLLVAYVAGYITRTPVARETDFTMTIGIFTLLFMETGIRGGLIPVNSKYTALFTHSPLGIQIVDSSGAAVLSSASPVRYDHDTFYQAVDSYPAPVRQDKNTLLFAAPVAGGYALWQEDITGLNRLYSEIDASVSKLKTANAILTEEEKIKRAAQEENEKTQLMAQLEAEISVHTIKLSTMIEQIENAIDRPKATARITLLLCYVKRRCNLFFREREAELLPADELTVYLDELAEIAGYSGVKLIVTSELELPVSIRRATLFYDLFYNVIYWAAWLPETNILTHLGYETGTVTLRLLLPEDARSFRMEKGLKAAIAAVNGVYAVKDLDDGCGISLSFPEGGEDNP